MNLFHDRTWVEWALALTLALPLYTYIGYPLLLALTGLFFPRKRLTLSFEPTVTMLIAAYNEELAIAAKLENTLALDYPREKLQILVVSDGSVDRTEEIVESYAARHPHIHLLHVPGRMGKTHIQNEGVKRATGEVIVFSDATAVYHRDALKYLAAHYQDSRIGAVSGRYLYFDPNGSPTGLGSVAFWNFENIIKKLQYRVRTLTGCSGCIYSVRKSAYVPLPRGACSDIVEPMEIVLKGYKVAFEERAVAYEETTANAGDEFRMRVRVAARGIGALLMKQELLQFWKHGWISFQLFSHKVCRWLVPLTLPPMLVLSGMLRDNPWIGAFFFLQVVFYAIAALSMVMPIHKLWKPLGVPLYFCTVSLAVVFGMYNVVSGRQPVVWETVRSS
jgi:cellulose synthase/poly-beta-1,6-N-acetylglucosamine synthase-like glycosyltransferase